MKFLNFYDALLSFKIDGGSLRSLIKSDLLHSLNTGDISWIFSVFLCNKSRRFVGV